ncbi:hypothetical protein FQR65_LT18689 [Abscondita terminalis]|nr:hypothetical protein FQR65_LT18689 [Abscondita terminalis]
MLLATIFRRLYYSTSNVPKEIMTFLDFPYPEQMNKSYIPQEQVLNYFNSYAKTFNLKQYIKFHKRVTEVKPQPDDKWVVTVRDAKTKIEESENFDAVFICSGHYNTPNTPEIPDGSLLSTTPTVKISENISMKAGISEITETGAIFGDGSKEDFDTILYVRIQLLFPIFEQGMRNNDQQQLGPICLAAIVKIRFTRLRTKMLKELEQKELDEDRERSSRMPHS